MLEHYHHYQKRLDSGQGELTCGATWHAAGLVTRFHGGNNFRLWHDEARGLIPSVAKHEERDTLEIDAPEFTLAGRIAKRFEGDPDFDRPAVRQDHTL